MIVFVSQSFTESGKTRTRTKWFGRRRTSYGRIDLLDPPEIEYDGLQEVVVAPDAATVFRRTGILSVQANRVLLRVSGQGLLGHYFMRPSRRQNRIS
jgi:hypothetical protein